MCFLMFFDKEFKLNIDDLMPAAVFDVLGACELDLRQCRKEHR